MTAIMKTRKAQGNLYAAFGVQGDALEALLRETAAHRHEARVQAAILAAEDYYLATVHLDRDEVSKETLRLYTAAILAADTIGVGGKEDVEGAGTDRHPAFINCGKGRKHATDGPAWSAAIMAAYRRLCNEAGCSIAFAPGQLGGVVIVDESGEAGLHEQFIPVRWMYAIAREGLRRAAGLNGVLFQPLVAMKTVNRLAQWASAVNEIAAARPAPQQNAYGEPK